jgi:hypothetical protein
MKQIIIGVVLFVVAAIFKIGGGSIDNAGTTSTPALAVSRSVSETFQAFKSGAGAGSQFGDLSDYSEIKVSSNPSESVVYKISSSHDSDGSTVAIKIIPGPNGGSIVSADIDVANVNYGDQYISESKVKDSLETSLNNAAASIDGGGDASGAMREINEMLISLAVLTNSKSEQEAMAKLGEHMGAGFGGTGGSGRDAAPYGTSFGASNSAPSAISGKPSGYGAIDGKPHNPNPSPQAISGSPSSPLPGGNGYPSETD